MEDRWLAWAKRLQAIASTGRYYSSQNYDRERYAEIGDVAQQMLASLAGVPIERIAALVPDYATGYATPKVEVRGAVFDGARLLMVREASDGLWTLPGGFADVGRSASENVVKEIQEEANLRVVARALYGIRHKAKHPYDPDARDFYKLYFHCERLDASAPQPGAETSAVGFFGIDEIPPLSRGRVIEADILAAFAVRLNPLAPVFFD